MRGIGNAFQSFEDAARTMYALVNAVNNIRIEASPTHMPMR